MPSEIQKSKDAEDSVFQYRKPTEEFFYQGSALIEKYLLNHKLIDKECLAEIRDISDRVANRIGRFLDSFSKNLDITIGQLAIEIAKRFEKYNSELEFLSVQNPCIERCLKAIEVLRRALKDSIKTNDNSVLFSQCIPNVIKLFKEDSCEASEEGVSRLVHEMSGCVIDFATLYGFDADANVPKPWLAIRMPQYIKKIKGLRGKEALRKALFQKGLDGIYRINFDFLCWIESFVRPMASITDPCRINDPWMQEPARKWFNMSFFRLSCLIPLLSRTGVEIGEGIYDIEESVERCFCIIHELKQARDTQKSWYDLNEQRQMILAIKSESSDSQKRLFLIDKAKKDIRMRLKDVGLSLIDVGIEDDMSKALNDNKNNLPRVRIDLDNMKIKSDDESIERDYSARPVHFLVIVLSFLDPTSIKYKTPKSLCDAMTKICDAFKGSSTYSWLTKSPSENGISQVLNEIRNDIEREKRFFGNKLDNSNCRLVLRGADKKRRLPPESNNWPEYLCPLWIRKSVEMLDFPLEIVSDSSVRSYFET